MVCARFAIIMEQFGINNIQDSMIIPAFSVLNSLLIGLRLA